MSETVMTADPHATNNDIPRRARTLARDFCTAPRAGKYLRAMLIESSHDGLDLLQAHRCGSF
jgi:hypothetical protein